jgi:hypothetical protein
MPTPCPYAYLLQDDEILQSRYTFGVTTGMLGAVNELALT